MTEHQQAVGLPQLEAEWFKRTREDLKELRAEIKDLRHIVELSGRESHTYRLDQLSDQIKRQERRDAEHRQHIERLFEVSMEAAARQAEAQADQAKQALAMVERLTQNGADLKQVARDTQARLEALETAEASRKEEWDGHRRKVVGALLVAGALSIAAIVWAQISKADVPGPDKATPRTTTPTAPADAGHTQPVQGEE
ncbi:MAG: hypothetical protein CMH57_02805 [Myxococcales bacterium]|nr:hypothetical protein [Myxococcales bacterium]